MSYFKISEEIKENNSNNDSRNVTFSTWYFREQTIHEQKIINDMLKYVSGRKRVIDIT